MIDYFKEEETECKCGCGLNNVDKNSLEMLNKSRGIAGVPFILNSACRCEKHNDNVGGSKTSTHIATKWKKSKAFDIKCTNSKDRSVILKSLQIVGFNRIGIYKTFIHADNDEDKTRNVVWVG